MTSVPIYLQQIKVENIKTFGTTTELQLQRERGVLSRWTLILGDNGIGKSTLLQLIAWMKPLLPYDGKSTGEETEPLITNEENEVLERLVHRSSKGDTLAYIEATFVANWHLNDKNSVRPSRCVTTATIGIDSEYHLNTVDVDTKAYKKGVFYQEDVTIYAYSASRQLGRKNIDNKNLIDTIPSFIREKTELYDAEEILTWLDYSSTKGAVSDRSKYKAFLIQLKKLLVDLLPDISSVDNINITPSKIASITFEGGVLITTKHGIRIPFSDFSLGYRTIASWVIDLAWRLFTKHHANCEEPLSEPAIVLIDELDLHLHPVWQRSIMTSLSDNFPHIQFIATAHSPLMVQAAAKLNYAVLQYNLAQECVLIDNHPTGIDGWRVDQILTSELFGLPSARGLKYDNLMAEREVLLEKSDLTKAEENRLASVTKQLVELPTGESPDEIQDRQQIANLAQRLREGQIKIEL